MEPVRNRVAESELTVFNLEELWDGRPVVEFDLAPFLVQGLVLREKEFRAAMKEHAWEDYRDKHVAVFCSTGAIVPLWAYMLVAARLHGMAAGVSSGSATDLIRDHFVRALAAFDWEVYRDRMVVVKGCGSKVVPVDAYVLAVGELQRVARKLMFGEPCSAVPLWRRPQAASEAAGAASAEAAIPDGDGGAGAPAG